MNYRLCILFLLFLACPVSAAEINVATSTYCPLVCDRDKAPRDGIMHEVLRKAFEGTEHTLVFHEMPYVRAVRDTLDGAYDVITFVGSDYPDFIFVRNMDMINVVQFATLSTSTWKYDGPDSLEDIRFSIPNGFRTGNPAIDDYLHAHDRDNTRVRVASCDNPTMAQHQNLECLLEGRIDAMLVGSLAFHSIERNLPEGRVRVDPTPVSMFYNRIGFSPRLKNVEALRDLVENRIQELRVSGELQEIFRYYGINP
ncbi:MAG: substrate-binding periplasmic protein [Pseudodesulfovibrio sp.]|uniref:Polar amino acid transport system substrate-binding protein n=1 Tax=Pseudodesulfovibrio indicus TaxID=1716143 RepID=A0A126QQK5_9BACT|nr:ABC transporter substrate-binding protein [Pseudodesulfovibrio indicus]AMK12007.1 hypothetical protein AWY79_13270 [Pseudodesulfovibrio indicus]TDT88605.1 polar amino acid transport system substrate-binding protein [Pseudodesulfovibrio indicus]